VRSLFTIGYEGAHIEDFVATLVAAGVTDVLDVRELPISRRKGFSKSALASHLEGAGIAYRHERRLGSPTDIRRRLREDGDFTRYFRGFDRYLKTQGEFISELVQELPGSVALVCYERNPDECHRKSVAAAMSAIVGIKPKHLGVREGSGTREAKAPRLRSRQSLSAA
jgi:uncharacterized protein (DUF488 family)